MSAENQPDKIADDVAVTMHYTLTIDGEVVDTSEGEEPIYFLQGHQNIIPGLERELYGMAPGDSQEATVKPEDAYGEVNPDDIQEVSKEEFPDDFPLEPGVGLDMQNQEGELLEAIVHSVGEDTVKLDFNHPLAGKTLHFKVTVVALRTATEEELEHGHVHGLEEEGH